MVVLKVSNPVLGTRGDGSRLEQFELDDIKRAEDPIIRGRNVIRPDAAMLAYEAHPTEARDQIRLCGHAGH
jgi:hypothetical protein